MMCTVGPVTFVYAQNEFRFFIVQNTQLVYCASRRIQHSIPVIHYP